MSYDIQPDSQHSTAGRNGGTRRAIPACMELQLDAAATAED
jgi:hypothetical protein